MNLPETAYSSEQPPMNPTGRRSVRESIISKKEHRSERLFGKILEYFSHESFTLKDMDESLNQQTAMRPGYERYNKNDLDYLVREGLLLFNEETQEYEVDHNSPKIARMMMGDDEDGGGNEEEE